MMAPSSNPDDEQGHDEDSGRTIPEEIVQQRRMLADEITHTPNLVAIVRMQTGGEVVENYILTVANAESNEPTVFLRVSPQQAETTTPNYTALKRATLCDTEGLFTRILNSDNSDTGVELLHLASPQWEDATKEHIKTSIDIAQREGVDASTSNSDADISGSSKQSSDDYDEDVKAGRGGVPHTSDDIRETEDPAVKEKSGLSISPIDVERDEEFHDGEGVGSVNHIV
jgi:hypothetical protein